MAAWKEDGYGPPPVWPDNVSMRCEELDDAQATVERIADALQVIVGKDAMSVRQLRWAALKVRCASQGIMEAVSEHAASDTKQSGKLLADVVAAVIERGQ